MVEILLDERRLREAYPASISGRTWPLEEEKDGFASGANLRERWRRRRTYIMLIGPLRRLTMVRILVEMERSASHWACGRKDETHVKIRVTSSGSVVAPVLIMRAYAPMQASPEKVDPTFESPEVMVIRPLRERKREKRVRERFFDLGRVGR